VFVTFSQISWGTKQDSIVEPDLGAVVHKGFQQVDVEMLTEEADVNALYDEAISNLRNRKPLDSPAVSAAEQDRRAKEYYANVRTNVGTFVPWAFQYVY
jgi:chitin synthase